MRSIAKLKKTKVKIGSNIVVGDGKVINQVSSIKGKNKQKWLNLKI